MHFKRTNLVLLVASLFVACGDPDKLDERTIYSSSPDGSEDNRRYGNRDMNAESVKQGDGNQLDQGSHSLIFTALKNDDNALIKNISVERNDHTFKLHKALSKNEPEMKEVCTDDCEVSVTGKGQINVIIAEVKNVGLDSFLIAIGKDSSPLEDAIENFRPSYLVEIVCRECTRFVVKNAVKSKCMNLRSIWINGDNCVNTLGEETAP